MKHTLKTILITSVLTLPSTFGANAAGYKATLNEEAQQGGVQTQAVSEKGTLMRLPVDLCDSSFGALTADRSKTSEAEKVIFTLGYLNIQEISKLARTSMRFRIQFEPILNAAKAWNTAAPIPRLLSTSVVTENDSNMIQLLGNPSPINLFHALVMLLADSRFLNHQSTKELEIAIRRNLRLQANEKVELVRLLDRSSPEKIAFAAYNLAPFGQAHYEKVATLYKFAANIPGVDQMNMYYIAQAFMGLGSRYYENAASLFLQTANHPDADYYFNLNCAFRLIDMGSAFYERAAVILEHSALHRASTSDGINSAVESLIKIRDTYPLESQEHKHYHDRANKLHKLAQRK
jgi:hypothetical protein